MMLSSIPPPQPAGLRYPRHEDIVRAIYADKRAGPEGRELLLAVAYAVYLTEPEEGVSPLREARRALGRNRIGKTRYGDLVEADSPRYELPYQATERCGVGPACKAPRLRPYRSRPCKPRTQPDPDLVQLSQARRLPPPVVRLDPGSLPPHDWRTEGGVCGAGSHHRVLEKDPRTGWVTAHWFCKRHTDHAERVAEQVREQNEAAPEPIPNTGGLLSCYFKTDWERVYRRYAPYWTPPAYGLCADDWPEPGQALTRSRGRLRILNCDPDGNATTGGAV